MGIRVGLIGFGTVGQAVARRLTDGRDRRLRLVRVCARAGGRTGPDWLAGSVGWSDRFDSLLAPDINLVVELVGGIEQARRWAHLALLAGKSVVTANKQLVAEHGPEIQSLAARQRCENVVIVAGELGGETVLSGQGAGGNATAVAVISDALAIASALEDSRTDRPVLSWLPRPPIASTAPFERTR